MATRRRHGNRTVVFLLTLLLAGASGGCAEAVPAPLADRLCDWADHPGNPLIEPPEGEFLIGDPTVLVPGESPDGRWHLFANSLLGIHHHVSDDGIGWERLSPALFGMGAFRPHVSRAEDGTYHLLFEKFLKLDRSEIRRSSSADLENWRAPTTVLVPELDWERGTQETVGNPFLMRREGRYWLYYSADGVFQEDTGFHEPLHIGLAEADELDGPWEKRPEPILSPAVGAPWRNTGAGSIKLLDEKVGGRWIALNNGIYLDEEGKSRSAILVLSSDDGIAWTEVCGRPVIAPEGDGWKRAFAYAFDTVRVGDRIWLYYNARDGWAEGSERIGLATLELPELQE